MYLNPRQFARFLRRLKPAGGVVHANGYEGAFLRPVAGGQAAFIVTSHHPHPPSLLDAGRSLNWIERARWIRRRIIPLLKRCALGSADLVTLRRRLGAAAHARAAAFTWERAAERYERLYASLPVDS